MTRAGGLNRFGEPNYRAVWGWNRLTLIGGEWEQDNEDGKPAEYAMRRVPKYPQVNRWIIEKWLPPENYGSRFDWQEKELGPYPYRGDYEHCFTLEGPDGGFIQLTPTVVEHIARRIETSRLIKSTKQAKRDREVSKEDSYVNWAVDRMGDTNEWSYTPHTYIPAKIKERIPA